MRVLIVFFLACFHCLLAFEKLPEQYRVTYGNPNAKIKIIEYFSFNCPHCIALFQKDFKEIKEAFIDTGNIYWVFHPIPTDKPTIQALVCFDFLNEDEKRLFLEVILEESDLDDSHINSLLMQKAMEVFDKEIPELQNNDYLEKTQACEHVLLFLQQNDCVNAVPTVEINGKLFEKEIPDFHFISSQIKKLDNNL